MSVTAHITKNKGVMSSEWALLHLDICKEVNKIPWATLTLIEGDASRRKFPVSDNKFFKPGSEIQIKLRHDDHKDKRRGPTVFEGVAVKQSVKSDLNGSTLSVELKDKSFKLAGERKNEIYQDKTDSDVITQIITRAGKLKVGYVEKSAPMHSQLVQHYCSDWDFTLSRCEANGLLLAVDDGEISVKKPDFAGKAALILEYGKDIIYNFEMEADIRNQHGEVSAACWGAEGGDKKVAVNSQKARDFLLRQGKKLKPKEAAQKIGKDKYSLQSLVPQNSEETKAWADARMIKDRLSMFRGRFRIPGKAELKPMDILEIRKFGRRFNGRTIITGVRHQVSEKGWRTDIQFGLSADWFSSRTDIIDAPAAGLLPAVNGLQVGVVEAFEEDKEGKFRIKTQIPAFGKKSVVWARLASLDAGEGRGSLFIPEKGDEVAVGFFNDDPRHPVILGSLYNPENKPPELFKEIAGKSNKGIVVKKKGKKELKIFLDGEKETIEISSASGNKIVIKDDAGIELEDKNGNKLILNDKGITVESDKELTLKCKKVITKAPDGTNVS